MSIYKELLKQVMDNTISGLDLSKPDIVDLKIEIEMELAKPETEPSAWMTVDRSENRRVAMVGLSEKTLDEYELKQIPLYTSPQPKPLTPSEWWDAAPWNYDMDIAPKDGTHIAIKSNDSLFDVGYWSGYRWDNTHDFFIDNPIAWLPLPEQK